METTRWRPGIKRRRFRNPLFLAGAAVVAALLVVYPVVNGVWMAVAGKQSPSLLRMVKSACALKMRAEVKAHAHLLLMLTNIIMSSRVSMNQTALFSAGPQACSSMLPC